MESHIYTYIKNILRFFRFIITYIFVLGSLLRLLFWRSVVNGYVVIAPSQTLSGAPLLSCAIYNRIVTTFPACYLSIFGGGTIVPDVKDVFCLHGVRSRLLHRCISFILFKKGYRHVFSNSIVSSEYTQQYKKLGFVCVSLIHEMKSAINYFNLSGKIDGIVESSDYIIFSSKLPHVDFSSFLTNPANLQQKVMFIKQGLYNTSIQQNICNKADDREEVRKTLQISAESKVVLGIGDDLERKGFDYFYQLAVQTPDCIFVWVTASNIPKSYQRKNLIITPSVRYDKIFPLYFAADVFFLSSVEDPFPSVILEAMAAGLPVISLKGSGGADEIVDEHTGLRVDKEFIQEASVFLNHFNGALADKFFNHNSEHVEKHYNFDDYVERIISLAK